MTAGSWPSLPVNRLASGEDFLRPSCEGRSAIESALKLWAEKQFDRSTLDLITEAHRLNKRLGFRVDCWVAANALLDRKGVVDLEERGHMITKISQAIEDEFT